MKSTTPDSVDVYAQQLARLDYVYPEAVGVIMATEKLEKTKSSLFEIDYTSPDTSIRDPFKIYMDNFGPQESGKSCTVCNTSCQGHYGVIRFPIIPSKGQRIMINHSLFEGQLMKILKVVCSECSLLTLNKHDNWVANKINEILELPRHLRLSQVLLLTDKPSGYTMCSNTSTTPAGCVHVCPTKSKHTTKGDCRVIREEQSAFPIKGAGRGRGRGAATPRNASNTPRTASDPKTIITVRDPRDIYDMLRLMSNEDLDIIGMSREDIAGMFIEEMFVIPTKFRPRNGKNRKNKLTSLLTKIIKFCMEYDGENNDKTIMKLTKAHKKYYEEWIKIIKGKEGLYKGSVLGKKAETSSRGVTVPADGLRVGEVVVPHHFASTALVTEILVTEDNLKSCQKLMDDLKVYQIKKVKNGIRPVQVLADNFADRSSHRLEVGDTIWRHAQDGDLTLLIRQPTQNKQNIVACVIKVNKDPSNYTLGTELSSPQVSNGDYDGDTYSNATAQTPEAREDMLKMLLSRNIRTAQNTKPLYSLYYHTVLASALISLPNIDITKELWCDCTSGIASYNMHRLTTLDNRLAKYDIPKYSARGLLSAAFHEDFYYRNDKDGVLIENGVWVSGMLKGSIVGSGSGGITDKMSIFYSGCDKSLGKCTCNTPAKCAREGWKKTADYISDATYILNRFLDSFGYTVGWKDSTFGPNVRDKVAEAVEKLNMQVFALKKPVGYYETIKYNKDIESLVNETRSIPGTLGIFKYDISKIPIVDSAGIHRPSSAVLQEQVGNNLIYMSKLVSGAKGDESNLASIGVLLGQQYLLGKALSKVITGNTRFLVTDRPNSSMVSQRGFVKGCYARGLEPREVFVAAHSNREGTASTQTNTPAIGTLQKDLGKLLENLRPMNGGAIFRDKVIINFSYGGDSQDTEEMLKVGGSSQSLDIDTMLGVLNSKSR